MSLSKLRHLPLALVLALAACTSGPLYGPTSSDPVTGQGQSILTELRGRIGVDAPNSRTEQIVRNALLFRLNGAEAVRDPLYTLSFRSFGTEQGVSVQGGTGIPTASVYRLQVDYSLRRVSDNRVIASGSRFATAPFDRSEQLFAAQRALLDARENAGRDVAERVTIAITPMLQREAFAGAAPR